MPNKYRLSVEQRIKIIREVKKTIMQSEVVTDTLWMLGGNETACEALDWILLHYGVNAEELQEDYDG